jgi:hypothetical protein
VTKGERAPAEPARSGFERETDAPLSTTVKP